MSDDGKIIPFRRPGANGSNGSNGHRDFVRVRVAPERGPEKKPSLVDRVKASPLTVLISAINVAYFIWIERHGSSHDTEVLVRFGAAQSLLVRSGDYWRIASYMIVHIGWAHLLMNTWAGGSWCIPVEQILGRVRFFLLYLLAGLGGGAAVVIFSDAVTAGASGAMFGIIGALLTIRHRQLPTWKMFVNDRGVRSTVAQIALWTVLGIVALPMSQAGHFGGLITGALFTYVLTMREKRQLGYLGFAVAFAGFVLYAAQPWAVRSKDWSKVTLKASGSPEEARDLVLQAGPACRRGVERACVIKALLELDMTDKESLAASRKVFEAGCEHHDKDACAGLGLIVSQEDVGRGNRMLNEACAAGSEWGCAYAIPGLANPRLRLLEENDEPEGEVVPSSDVDPDAADASDE